jgi:hypothetical protein
LICGNGWVVSNPQAEIKSQADRVDLAPSETKKILSTCLTFERVSEFFPAHADTIKPPAQAFKTRISLATFDATDVVSMEIGVEAESFLRQATILPKQSKDDAECFAGWPMSAGHAWPIALWPLLVYTL